MNVEAFAYDNDREEDSKDMPSSLSKFADFALHSVLTSLFSFVAKRLEFYIYFHILDKYHRRQKPNRIQYNNILEKLSNLDQLSIAILYQVKNELTLYDAQWSEFPMIIFIWFSNMVKYHRHPSNVSITAVHKVSRLNTNCKIQELCKVLFISSLIAPDDHGTLNPLLMNLQSQLSTTNDDPDEAKCFFDACVSELKQQPILFEANATSLTENLEYEQGPTEVEGRLHENSIPLEKPNHMALLYSMEQDESLQSLLASELMLKSSDHVPI